MACCAGIPPGNEKIDEYPNREIVIGELRLGDVVKLGDGPYCTAHVTKITKDEVFFHRPYGSISDFSCGDPPSVIFYTGLEVFSRPVTDKGTCFVYQRAVRLR
jgi:hypothetical protein